jgi:hypothetical protein
VHQGTGDSPFNVVASTILRHWLDITDRQAGSTSASQRVNLPEIWSKQPPSTFFDRSCLEFLCLPNRPVGRKRDQIDDMQGELSLAVGVKASGLVENMLRIANRIEHCGGRQFGGRRMQICQAAVPAAVLGAVDYVNQIFGASIRGPEKGCSKISSGY